MEIKNIYGAVIYTSQAATVKDAVVEAVAKKSNLRGANLRGADLRGAYLTGANLRGAYLRGANGEKKKIVTMRVFADIYEYQVWAVLFEDGSRWIRMGCLWKSMDEWESVGIRKSNLSQYPDDGSDKSEERVAAFEFAKAAALRMKP